MTRYICIHGHFYQPPRENPWLEAIQLQESAHPYHDWNERVAAEAYTPNSASRILDDHGKIVRIVNNYGRMSFNFGPTLLSWMEETIPDTYRRLLEADRESQGVFGGHGCAIAQAYNHMIMPLADRRDKETQVLWGIADFRHRFGREPEGMWLPETAADTESLEVLAEHGIRFTILAPGQARRVRKLGKEAWEEISGTPNTRRPYLVRLPSGRSIHVFFYDGAIARSVAFEKLLHRGDALVDALIGGFDGATDDPLVHFATDGETFGHHHPWGDMALAWALEQIGERDDVRLTNYAQYLEQVETAWEAEIVEPSSWSCAHGVGRWRTNCGCHTGGREGWTQEWRGPLRDALDWLRDSVRPLYEAAAATLLRDPWAARDDYVEVVLDRGDETVDAFLMKHRARDLSANETVAALELLEIQRHAMLMYTSCGWFFNDVSGIETIQILQYAGRVVQLAKKRFDRDLEPEILARLRNAKSNDPEAGDAAAIWERSVRPAMVDLPRVAAHYAVAAPFGIHDAEDASVHCYDVRRVAARELRSGRAESVLGHVRIRSRITRESGNFTFGVLYLGDLDLTGGVRAFRDLKSYAALENAFTEAFDRSDFSSVIRVLDRELGSTPFSINSLFADERRRILGLIWNETLVEAEGAWRVLYERYVPLMRLHARAEIPLPRILQLAAEFSVNMAVRRELDRERLDLPLIRSLIADAKTGVFDLDRDTLSRPLEQTIEQLSRHLVETADTNGIVERFLRVLELVAELPFKIDLWRAQNAYYLVQQKVLPSFVQRASDGDAGAGHWIAQFERLGERLGIRSDWLSDPDGE